MINLQLVRVLLFIDGFHLKIMFITLPFLMIVYSLGIEIIIPMEAVCYLQTTLNGRAELWIAEMEDNGWSAYVKADGHSIFRLEQVSIVKLG